MLQFFSGIENITVKYVDHYGDDITIVQSARLSTDGSFKGWEKDRKFLTYLYTNQHLSPFEMCDLTVDVHAPIFIARQWMRHRTFSYNEFSGRYAQYVPDFYIPEKLFAQDLKNKQLSSNVELDVDIKPFRDAVLTGFNEYCRLLQAGVSREQARLVLPLCTFTTFRCKGNLRNWLHFLKLRLDLSAQAEIRHCAEQVKTIIKYHWPETFNVVFK